MRLYANQRSNSSVCFSLCEVNVIWNNALDACSLIYRKNCFGFSLLVTNHIGILKFFILKPMFFVQTLLTRVLNKNWIKLLMTQSLWLLRTGHGGHEGPQGRCLAQCFFVTQVIESCVIMRPGTEMPSLNISMFHSCQEALIFSMSSKKGTTSKLLYQVTNSLTVIIWFSSHTCWRYRYSSSEMFWFLRVE